VYKLWDHTHHHHCQEVQAGSIWTCRQAFRLYCTLKNQIGSEPVAYTKEWMELNDVQTVNVHVAGPTLPGSTTSDKTSAWPHQRLWRWRNTKDSGGQSQKATSESYASQWRTSAVTFYVFSHRNSSTSNIEMFGDYVTCLITDITDTSTDRYGPAEAEAAVLCACAAAVGAWRLMTRTSGVRVWNRDIRDVRTSES